MQNKGTVMLSTSLAWPAVQWLAAAGQKLSLNLAPFLFLNPVDIRNLYPNIYENEEGSSILAHFVFPQAQRMEIYLGKK